MLEPVATPHLDAYVPERRKAVAQLRLVVSNSPPPDPERLAIIRESAKRLITTFARLESLAETVGIDFEATIYELAVEEQDHLRQTMALSSQHREATRLAGEVRRLRAGAKMDPEETEPVRRLMEDTAEVTAINREVYEAYKRCRQNLERLRDVRLAAYAATWADYLETLESVVTPPLAQAVRKVWAKIGPDLWAPEATPREESFLLVWDRGRHHLQMEIFSAGTYDWFHRDRSANTFQAQEDVPVGRIPSPLRAAIRKTRKG